MALQGIQFRRFAAKLGFSALALTGLCAIGIGAIGAIAHCYDICDPASRDWFSRPGAWQRWVQLALVVVVGALLLAAAASGFRRHYRRVALLVVAAAPILVVWILVVS